MVSPDLKTYFDATEGVGVLSTVGADGSVNSALYARPRCFGDELAFIMLHRQSYDNLQQHPQAAYLFLEKSPGYRGLRLQLSLLRQEQDPARIAALLAQRGRQLRTDEPRSLVYFRVDAVQPLLGANRNPHAED